MAGQGSAADDVAGVFGAAVRTDAVGLLIYARGRPLWSAARPDEILPPLDEGDR